MKPQVLVVTIVHRPLDARIHARQIRAMREAGWPVTYAAPWTDTGTRQDPELATIDLPRAVGRRRLHAIRTARQMLRTHAGQYDLVLLHDPELLFSVAGLQLPPVVWDVHEDVAASLTDRDWIPRWSRPVLQLAIRLLERWAEHQHHIILAESSYADRFLQDHPVVRNLPWVPKEVPPPGPGRAVYIGRISPSRGIHTLLEIADLVPPDITIELVGYADPEVEEAVARAHADGRIVWHGFLANKVALELIQGATVGLSLLRDEPNFRGSLPSKVVEYMARGLPVISTPLPEAEQLLRRSGGGSVVPFDNAQEATIRIVDYHDSSDLRVRVGQRGHEEAVRSLDWSKCQNEFLDYLLNIAQNVDKCQPEIS